MTARTLNIASSVDRYNEVMFSFLVQRPKTHSWCCFVQDDIILNQNVQHYLSFIAFFNLSGSLILDLCLKTYLIIQSQVGLSKMRTHRINDTLLTPKKEGRT